MRRRDSAGQVGVHRDGRAVLALSILGKAHRRCMTWYRPRACGSYGRVGMTESQCMM